MENKQSSEGVQEFYVSIKEFIDTIEESETSESKVNGILALFKLIIEHLESGSNVSAQQSKLLYSFNDSFKANLKVASEFDERITKLENMVTDITSNSLKLAEITKKIPVINIDNLLKTLNEHSDEINENTASINTIKEKLKKL